MCCNCFDGVRVDRCEESLLHTTRSTVVDLLATGTALVSFIGSIQPISQFQIISPERTQQ